jgi:hypothetical protein
MPKAAETHEEIRDVADGLWIWRVRHPHWNPEVDWQPIVTSVCVDVNGEVLLLDPLMPPAKNWEVWTRLESRPPTAAVVLKPDHVRDIDLVVGLMLPFSERAGHRQTHRVQKG